LQPRFKRVIHRISVIVAHMPTNGNGCRANCAQPSSRERKQRALGSG
jgi:hypothetical protein